MRPQRPLSTHPADVIARLHKKGGTLTALAGDKQLHPSALGHCLRRCIPAANQAIADFLGVTVHELWPEWFDTKGRRIATRRNASRIQIAAKRQKVRAFTDKRSAA